MTDFVFATTPIDTAIPVVAVVFNINNLIYDETDPLTDITARVNLVSTGQSPVIDDTGAFLYGWPRERSSSNANQITVIPLPATKDATGDGVHIRNLAGTDVHYTLTVTGTRNNLPVTLVNAQRFDVDAATPNGTLFADLTAQPSAQFTQPLSATAQAAVDAYIVELLGLGSITGASAYEVAVADGFVGDETAWLTSLEGADGTTPDGATLVVDGGLNLTATTLNAGLTELADGVTNLGLNVKNYGAIGDGTTNDTSAIQSAVTAAISAGLTVRIPAGTYKADNIQIAGTVSIIHDHGAAFVPTSTGSINGAFYVGAGTTGSHLQNVRILGGEFTGENRLENIIRLTFVDGAEVVGVVCSDPQNAGLSLISCTESVIARNRVDAATHGISIYRCATVSVTSNHVTGSQLDGIQALESTDSTINANTISVFDGSGAGGRGGIQTYGSDRITITGNIVTGGNHDTSPCIRLRNSRDNTVTGNICSDSLGEGITVVSHTAGGYASGGGDTITGNIIFDVRNTGINCSLNEVGTTLPLVITGNKVRDVIAGSSSTGVGIVTTAAPASTVSGNVIDGTANGSISLGIENLCVGNKCRQMGANTHGVTARLDCVVYGNSMTHATDLMRNAVYVLANCAVGENHADGWYSSAIRNDGAYTTNLNVFTG